MAPHRAAPGASRLATPRRHQNGFSHCENALGALAGVISLLAYWIVIWAMTQAPLALVSAVRETSMVFAVLFGVFFLKERLDLSRLASTGMTLIGTVMIKMSK